MLFDLKFNIRNFNISNKISNQTKIYSLLYCSIYFYCNKELCFVHHLHCTPLICGKRLLKFIPIENLNTTLKCSH